jgi:6-phosphogluconolactonase
VLASKAIGTNGRFTVALSGGSTPQPLYTLLATGRYANRIDWSHVHIFWGDERCVPLNDPQCNYRMAREALLDTVPIPRSNIHRIRGEDDPEQAAAEYEQALRTFFESGAGYRPSVAGFDLVLLGMGENGHIASLFPGLTAVTEQVRWVMAQYIEAIAMWRVTLTPVVINVAKNITFLVSGANKAKRVKAVLEGPLQPKILPAQAIRPTHGQLVWFVDKAAAARLNC